MKPAQHAPSGNLVGSLADILASAQSAFDTGDHARAEEILRQVLEAQPKVAAAWKLRGLNALKYGRDDDSKTFLEQSLRLNAEDAGTLFHLGNACLRDSEFTRAIELFERSVALRADIPETHNNLSAALRFAGRPSDAEAAAQQALQLDQGYGEAANNLGLALCDLSRYPEAVRCFERAIEINPENLEALNNLGVALDAEGEVERARDIFERALSLHPENIDAKINLGNLLRKTGRLEDAAAQYSEALDQSPGDLRAYANLGLTLINKNQPEDAVALYEKALALAPDTPDIQMSLGIAQLMLGDYESGWRNYEARWQAPSFTARRRTFTGTPWTGQSLAGKSILVYAEQGFGDTIQFARYLPLIAEQAGKVVFECQKTLKQLCTSLDGVSQLVVRGHPLPKTDFYIPLMSLPFRMSETVGHVPVAGRYFNSESARMDAFRQRLQSTKPAVGLVWSGNPDRQDDWMRSCPAGAMRPLLDQTSCEFVSLQFGASAKDLPAETLDFGAECRDFADTAAAIDALDLVITVDTATAHLAGALGKDVWVMLGHHADWRYLMRRTDSPWYPSMRLYRQEKLGEWDSVVQACARDLSAGIGTARA